MTAFVSVTNSGQASNQTSLVVSVPAVDAGDRLICTICHGTSTDDGGDAPANWTKLSGTYQGMSVYERIFASSAGAGTVTFTQDNSNWWAAQVYRLSGSHASEATQISARVGATSANPNPASLTPTGGAKDWFWIADIVYGHAGGTDRTTSAYPTDYTSTTDSDPGGAFGQVRVASGYRALNAASEDPGTFTLTGSLAWIAVTLAVPPSVVEVALAGAKPAPSGTLGVQYKVTLAGAKPAPSGSPGVQYNVSLAGNKPAASGTIAAVITGVNINLAGSKPAPTGVLSVQYFIALAGAKPAGAGTPLIKYLVTLAGSKPAASGSVIATQLTPLTGAKPAPSGQISLIQYLIALAGAKPAPSGSLGLQYYIALAGNRPAASGGVLSVHLVSLQGIRPAPSGSLAFIYNVALEGNRPAASGTVTWRFLIFAVGRGVYAPVAVADPARFAPVAAVPADSAGRYAVTSQAEQGRRAPTATGEGNYG